MTAFLQDLPWLFLFRITLIFLAIKGILIGLLSFFMPSYSIALYQWIMRFCNWRVEPIDSAKEINSTRFLGIVLSVLSFVIGYLMLRF